MIVLAVLLLLAVALVTVFLLVAGVDATVPLEWDALNLSWSASPLVLFLLGAVTLLAAMVALGLLRSGTRRKVGKRREIKRLRKVEKEQATTTGTSIPDDGADREQPSQEQAPTRVQDPVPDRTPDRPDDASATRDRDARGSWHDAPPERR